MTEEELIKEMTHGTPWGLEEQDEEEYDYN